MSSNLNITQHDTFRIARSVRRGAAIIRMLSNGTCLAFGSVEDARGHPSTRTETVRP